MDRILVVEDEKETADAIARFLKRKGFDIDVAYDLSDALTKNISDYQIVLLDILLKGEKSFPMLKKIKQEQPKLPVIIVSAYDNDENIAEAKKLGADGFIAKPVMTEYLENFLLSKIHSLRRKAE
ncbi:MAG: response regulator [Candidatus Omnitrophica bacterium]|jgi:DNA-binding response OmpR family regulator|nr:response regulator [Candidatus Omnitrophota bacterium]